MLEGPEYPNSKRMKTEPDTEPAMPKDGTEPFPVSPIYAHPYSIPVRTKTTGQWGSSGGWATQGDEEDSTEENGNSLTILPTGKTVKLPRAVHAHS
jgi:hypothetical protein